LKAYARANPIDVVVETVGDASAPGLPGTLQQGIALVRRGGSVVILGVFVQPASLHPGLMVLREVRLIGSVGYGRGAIAPTTRSRSTFSHARARRCAVR
jgi:threonine dehydrogenase-like Zn-dependent dehydrogenase